MSVLFFFAGFVAFAYVVLLLGGVAIGLGGCAVGAARALRAARLRKSALPPAPRRLLAPGGQPAPGTGVAIAVAPAAA